MPEFSLASLRGLLPQMSGANFGTASPQELADMPLTGLDRAVQAAGAGVAQTVATPGELAKPNPYPEGSEAWSWYNDQKAKAAMKWAPEMAVSMIGSPAAVGGVPGTVGSGIKAYHSSPHDFDKFDLSKIGSGEGAQVYGHGLYFAENPAVSGQGGQYWQQFANRFGSGENTAAQHLANAGFDRELAAQRLRDMIANPNETLSPHNLKTVQNMRQEALGLLEGDKPVGPRTYEVNINADPAHFLDWDRQVTARAPEPIRNALNTIANANPGPLKDALWTAAKEEQPGWYFHSLLSDRAKTGDLVRNQKYASDLLNEAGIPGIKYLDQGSRVIPGQVSINRKIMNDPTVSQAMRDQAKADLTEWESKNTSSNYVVFNDKLIDIMRKYGLAGLAPLAGVGAMAGQQQDQPQM